MNRIVIIRTPSGISGDMLVAGLARLNGYDEKCLEETVSRLGLTVQPQRISLGTILQEGIAGWRLMMDLPHEHAHRNCMTILGIIDRSDLSDEAKRMARNTFELLAQVEGQLHGVPPEEVTFHEVGALDSIIDICLAAQYLASLEADELICSPLPVCDGSIRCAHGLLSTPAPATLELLRNVPIYGIASEGETVTPTALAFLKAAGAWFGNWPPMEVDEVVRVFGGRTLPGIPNGAIFCVGRKTEVCDPPTEHTVGRHP